MFEQTLGYMRAEYWQVPHFKEEARTEFVCGRVYFSAQGQPSSRIYGGGHRVHSAGPLWETQQTSNTKKGNNVAMQSCRFQWTSSWCSLVQIVSLYDDSNLELNINIYELIRVLLQPWILQGIAYFGNVGSDVHRNHKCKWILIGLLLLCCCFCWNLSNCISTMPRTFNFNTTAPSNKRFCSWIVDWIIHINSECFSCCVSVWYLCMPVEFRSHSSPPTPSSGPGSRWVP